MNNQRKKMKEKNSFSKINYVSKKQKLRKK